MVSPPPESSPYNYSSHQEPKQGSPWRATTTTTSSSSYCLPDGHQGSTTSSAAAYGGMVGRGGPTQQKGDDEAFLFGQQPHPNHASTSHTNDRGHPPHERPTSAPPPPGFADDPIHERNRIAEEILFLDAHNANKNAHSNPSYAQYQHLQSLQPHPQPNHGAPHDRARAGLSSNDQGSGDGGGGGSGSGGGGGNASGGGSVSSSSSQPHAFSNLAAVLGSGLAESMMWNGPSTSSNNNSGSGNANNATTNGNNNGNGSGNPSNSSSASQSYNINLSGSGGDDSLSWARQTRHAASRLLGASPPKFSISSGSGSGSGGTVPTSTQAFAPSPFAPPSSTASNAIGHSGFPSALSSPHRPGERATTPVELTAGTKPHRPNVPSHQIGMNVVEPEPGATNDFSGLNSFVTSSTYGGLTTNDPVRPSTATTHGASVVSSTRTTATSTSVGMSPMTSSVNDSFLWSPNAPEFVPYETHGTSNSNAAMAGTNQHHHNAPVYSIPSSNQSVDSGGGASLSELSAQQAEADIYQFLWDIDRNKPSRTICILRVSWLRAPDVRSACEAYGVLDSFRADFSSKGIYFCSYYDIRSAQYAAVELQSVLQRMLVLQRSSDEVIVRYCLPLSSSSQFDESQLSITDLPPGVDESHLANMLSSYGAVRSVFPNGSCSFIVEFFSVQDAKQALLELDSSQPWGPSVNVETGARNPVERKRGRELLATLSRWRQQLSAGSGTGGGVAAAPMTMQGGAQQLQLSTIDSNDPWGGRSNAVRGPGPGGVEVLNPVLTPVDATGFAVAGGGMTDLYPRQQQNATPQLVLGPDGRYQVIMPATALGGRAAVQQQPQQAQQIVQGPNGQLYVIPVSGTFLQQASTPRIGNFNATGQQRSDAFDRRPVGVGANMPYYTHVVAASDVVSLGSGRSSYRSNTSTTEGGDNRHLMLDLEEVENGIDTRTSLMVRNIPNKYTQQMLLSEFEENGHGPGVIDFFYLPIDFKNRCNRGYAFINFVDYKDILMFHRRYYGKHWRTFNSDKICDITYARIQGKAAMLKRFENSALMEKDDEYKPLVFVSDGPNKGQRLPFPGPASVAGGHHP